MAERFGLRPFTIADESRTLCHAGAAIASNHLVTLHPAAATPFALAGAPPDALVPLMRGTSDNGFDLTGPTARGDWTTVHPHVAEIAKSAPELEDAYRALAKLTAA